jgi:hypothetical protein
VRRRLLGCGLSGVSTVGFVLALGGALAVAGSSSAGTRVMGAGCLLTGVPLLLYQRSLMPEETPRGTKRFVALYAWFWILAGAGLCVLSWW